MLVLRCNILNKLCFANLAPHKALVLMLWVDERMNCYCLTALQQDPCFAVLDLGNQGDSFLTVQCKMRKMVSLIVILISFQCVKQRT